VRWYSANITTNGARPYPIILSGTFVFARNQSDQVPARYAVQNNAISSRYPDILISVNRPFDVSELVHYSGER